MGGGGNSSATLLTGPKGEGGDISLRPLARGRITPRCRGFNLTSATSLGPARLARACCAKQGGNEETSL